MTERDPLLEAMYLVTNKELYEQRMTELRKAKYDAEQMIAKAEKVKTEAEEFTSLSEKVKQHHHAELSAKQKEHDDAAKEAEARIRVANEQAAELLKLRDQLGVREKNVKVKEEALAQEALRVDRLRSTLDDKADRLADQEKKLNAKIKYFEAAPT